jgi:hypothetical protein
MKETTADGEEILHVTNLDASGKRIGGEIRHAPETSAPPARDAAEYRGSPEAPSAPVIVNIYQPPPPVQGGYTEGYSSPYMYRDPYAANYPGGILPGYYPRVYGYGGFRYGGYRGGCSWPAGGQHPSMRPAPAPRHIAEPVYSPIGPATGFDLYYQHTKDTLRR